MNRFFCFLCLLAFTAGLGGNAGCSRQHYRHKADQEIYSVLRQGNNDPRWRVDDYRITPDATSRMYNPFNPDGEPMPTDDPASHRKMHNVGGMKGSHGWYEHGRTQHVENPRWRQYLLVNEKGEIPLDKERALELSIVHSPDYQAARERLYLAAMAVSEQRFRYDVQYFGNSSNGSPRGSLNYDIDTLENSAGFGINRRFATGGTLLVDLANSITWSLTGEGSWNAGTTLNAVITQPLLRNASRKVELENLTQAERNFLAALRQMVFYQQGHYTRIVTGTVPQNTGASGSGGFYQLLSEQIQIQNQRQQIIGLEDNLNRFDELFEAGQSERINIEETRQRLLQAQSNLLGRVNSYQNNIEAYIRSLGLPPDLQVTIDDPLLEQFQLISPTLTLLMENVGGSLAIMREREQPLPENFREQIKDVIRRAEGEIAVLHQDLEMLQRGMPERIANLQKLETVLAERIAGGERIAPDIYDSEIFINRINTLRNDEIPRTLSRLQASFTLLHLIADTDEETLREMIRNRSFEAPVQEALMLLNLSDSADAHLTEQQREFARVAEELKQLQEELGVEPTPEPDAQSVITEVRRRDNYRDWVRRAFSVFQNELVTLSLMQTRTRLDTMTLVPVSVTPEEAFQIASENRLDWMNRRAALVDAWREIDIMADALKGVLNLRVAGNLGTTDRYGVQFSKNNSDLTVGLTWASPLTRHAEMMNYRSSQIAYQRARRDYYTYVDTVQAELRNTLRDVQMSQINFEINRNAVLIGTIRVDVMQLRMERPPTRAGIDTNISRQLIDALDDLTRSQNDLLNTWVTFQTRRMVLDCYMGTMQLDERGRWIEPDVMSSTAGGMREQAPFLSIPVPIIETPRLNRRYVEE